MTDPAAKPGRLPDLLALDLLVAVAETGSLGRAAERFSISQPSASERMRSLERRLGVQLLYRSTAGSRLTPAGLVVTDWARDLLDRARAFTEGVAALKSEQAGRLRIAASLTLAEHLVPAWLTTLRRGHPELHVGLHVMNSSHVIEAMRRDDADLGFIETPSVPADLRSATVGRDRLVVVTAPDHAWASRRTPLTGHDLSATPLLLRETGSGTRETFERALHAYNGPAEPALELGATTPLRSAAVEGAAPAVLSRLAVADDLTAGRLVEIPVDEELKPRLARTLRAVWPTRRDLSVPAANLLTVARTASRASRAPAANRRAAPAR